jgi:hypothetical protein
MVSSMQNNCNGGTIYFFVFNASKYLIISKSTCIIGAKYYILILVPDTNDFILVLEA